jgi:hypothetical protein
MAGYRPDVLTDPFYWTYEPIDDDLGHGAGPPGRSTPVGRGLAEGD